METAAAHGVEARIVGRVEARTGDAPRLTIQGPESMETYT